ncbi:aminopeptidase N [Corynebacterium freiburgense]|uniref:aminopeptidase N n=1 Tax=Corynebacterium freiburgense TaxID=556548 RepID=UPI0003FF5F92|nr:aminopeptidase N [Corynebacterium freiburgense]WJZ03428.1 Aminopeptidase N [Corynebacterium freiburgense]
MTSLNLTQAEAAARAALISVDHYDISLDLTQGEQTFPSRTTVRFSSLAGSSFIDLRGNLESVLLDGKDITPEHYDSNGIPLELTEGEHTLEVSAICEYTHTGEGMHRFTDPVDNETYLYTQFETAFAKQVFACFDQPDMKATYSLRVVTPAGWRVISNAEQQVSGENVLIHTSTIDYLLPTYLIAICAGPYHEVRDHWSGTLTHHPETPADQPHNLEVPLGLYCRKSLAKHLDAERLFTETKQGFDWYHAHFGMAYPFGKYDQIFCPEYNMGAMENAGCVTIRDEYVFSSKVTGYLYERRAETVLHELAHMWFGDLVTMRWWGDLWLNESFATWSAAISQAEATEYSNAWVTFANVEKSWAYQQDQLPSTHPVVTDATDIETVEQNFDGITYAKGASILKQLQAYVGREEFLSGVRKHFANHAFGNATFEDLLQTLEEASGRDLSSWASQWLTTTGINTLRPKFTVQNGSYASFSVEQGGADPRNHRIAIGLYSLIDGRVQRTHRVEVDIAGPSTAIPELLEYPVADLVLVNDDDLTYCLLGLDPDSLQFVVEHIGDFADPMPRTLCWSATWEMTRNAEMRARDFISLVARGITAETEIAVLERILNQVIIALDSYADPAWAQEIGRDQVVDLLLSGARQAMPGSDAQLAFLKALGRVRLNDKALQFFTDLSLEGLTIDQDLRWLALTARIAHGAVADIEGAIAAELELDNSSTSQMFAERARAAVNTPANKLKVFEAITGGELTNLQLRHQLEGFTWAGSAPNLEQFNERFFVLAPSIWQGESKEIALKTLTGAYPSWDISDAGLARAEEFLKSAIHPPGLIRTISEERARVERALRNRRYDGRV